MKTRSSAALAAACSTLLCACAGALAGIAYIQRAATQGGVAPASPCDSAAVGRKEVVKYQADYIFWKTAGV